jgi:hypothetical protein
MVTGIIIFTVDNSPLSQSALRDLENIDDDCSRQGIEFVKTDDKKAIKDFGIDNVPALVYFENRIPNLYDGQCFFSIVAMGIYFHCHGDYLFPLSWGFF